MLEIINPFEMAGNSNLAPQTQLMSMGAPQATPVDIFGGIAGALPSLTDVGSSILQSQPQQQQPQGNIFQPQGQQQQPQQQQPAAPQQEQPTEGGEEQGQGGLGVGDYANMFMAAALAAYRPEMLPLLQYLQNFQNQNQQQQSPEQKPTQQQPNTPPPTQGAVVNPSQGQAPQSGMANADSMMQQAPGMMGQGMPSQVMPPADPYQDFQTQLLAMLGQMQQAPPQPMFQNPGQI